MSTPAIAALGIADTKGAGRQGYDEQNDGVKYRRIF